MTRPKSDVALTGGREAFKPLSRALNISRVGKDPGVFERNLRDEPTLPRIDRQNGIRQLTCLAPTR